MVNGINTSSNALASNIWNQLVASDKDGDGKLNKAEMQTAAANVGAINSTDTDYSKAFAKMDTNGDGYITKDEFNTMFQNGNANKDLMSGLVSKEVNLMVAQMQEQLMKTFLAPNDSSNTSSASDYFSSPSQIQNTPINSNDVFTQLDTNKDGKIDKNDFNSLGNSLLGQLQTYNSALTSNSAVGANSNLLSLLNG